MRSLTVIVPVLNESVLLPEFLEKTTSDLARAHIDYELILVNDGSSDDSLAIMQRFASGEPRIRVLDLPRNLGPGGNLHRAYALATKELACYATVDGFYDTALLPELLTWFDQGYDAVSAYRTDLSAHAPTRRVQTLLNVGLQRVLFPYRFRAYHTLQIHRTDFVQGIELESCTPFLCSELLFKATELGLRIKEVGIPYLPRKAGKATGGNPRLILRHLADVLRFWTRWFVLRRPMLRPGFHLEPWSTSQIEPVLSHGEA